MKNKKIILGLGTITALGAMSVGFIACVKKKEIEDMNLADKAGLEELKTKIGDLEKKLKDDKDAIDEKTKKLAKQIDDKTTKLSELIKNLVIEKIDLINDILEDKFGVQGELIAELTKSMISIITDDLTNLILDKTKDLSILTKDKADDFEAILAQIMKNILKNKISQDEEIKKLKDQLEKIPLISKYIEGDTQIKSIIKNLDKLEDVNGVLGEIKIDGVKELKAELKDGSSTDVLVKIIVESEYRLVGKDTFEIKDAIKTKLNLADIESNTEIKKIKSFENLGKVNEALQKITIPGVTRLTAELDGQSTTDVVVTIEIDATKYTLDKKTFKIVDAIKKEVKLKDIKDKFKDIKGKNLQEVQDKLNKLLPEIKGVKSLTAVLNTDKKTITINITMQDTHKIDTTTLILEDVIEK